jgi:dipeptidyl aminopeptidase/acylaminoacyl peptidase
MAKRAAIYLILSFLISGFLVAGMVGCDGTPTPTPTPTPTIIIGKPATMAPATAPPTRAAPVAVATPGPLLTSEDRLLYVRSGGFWTSKADGTDRGPLSLSRGQSPLFSPPKDPGRAWLSPQEDKMAYLVGGRAALWVANVDGTDNCQVVERLLPEEGETKTLMQFGQRLVFQEMAWTADEGKLAFIGAPEGQFDLFLVDLERGDLIQVTDDEQREDAFVWSPDGQYLAFKSIDEAFANEFLYVVKADGTGLTPISSDPIAEAAGRPSGSPLNGVQGITWLDEKTLFFYPLAPRGSVGIWKADVIAGTVEAITTERIADLDWSDEARSWVFGKQGETGSLWVLTLEEGPSATLRAGLPTLLASGGAYSPLWTPDGTQILYSRETEATAATWSFHLVPPDGSVDRELVGNVQPIQRDPSEPGPAGKRFWSPQGDELLYSAAGRDYGVLGGADLENWWKIPLEGGLPKQLTNLEKVFYLQSPQWSPDGKSLAFVGFSYTDRALHLWTVGVEGGNVEKVDAGVRWFHWLKSE